MRRFWYFFTVLPLAKLRLSWFKFTVMSLPIVILAAMMVVLNILSTSAWHIAQDKVLPAIGDREKLIGLDKNGAMNIAGQKIDPAPYFTKDEIASFQKRGDLASVTVVRPGHGLSGSTTDLLPGTKVFTNHINGIDARVANLLGVEKFAFEEGQPIPIIIGRSSLKQWREIVTGLEEASADQREKRLAEFQRQPSYTTTVDEDAILHQLIGKTFAMKIGELSPLPILYSTQTLEGQTYELIPSKVRDEIARGTNAEIGKFWDLDELQQGVEVKFRVVGLDYSLDRGATAVPYEAIGFVLRQLQQHTAKAQIAQANPDTFGRTFVGLQIKDDGYIWADGSYGGRLAISKQSKPVDRIFIPGLVYPSPDIERDTVIDNLFTAEQLPPTRVTLELVSLENKNSTINSLVMKGYSGISSTDNYSGVAGYAEGWQSLSARIINLLAIISIAVTGFLMLRTVKQAQFDSGVMRALGASKGWTLVSCAGLFVWQLGLAISAGLLIGGGVMSAAAPYLADWLQHSQSLPLDLILKNYGLVITLQPDDLRQIDWVPLGQKIGSMAIIAGAGVAVAALLATRVSPVEAVRRE